MGSFRDQAILHYKLGQPDEREGRCWLVIRCGSLGRRLRLSAWCRWNHTLLVLGSPWVPAMMVGGWLGARGGVTAGAPWDPDWRRGNGAAARGLLHDDGAVATLSERWTGRRARTCAFLSHRLDWQTWSFRRPLATLGIGKICGEAWSFCQPAWEWGPARHFPIMQ